MSGDGILVTYDNPISYPQIIASLKRVGRIKYAPTRTTVLLRLRDGKDYRDLRRAGLQSASDAGKCDLRKSRISEGIRLRAHDQIQVAQRLTPKTNIPALGGDVLQRSPSSAPAESFRRPPHLPAAGDILHPSQSSLSRAHSVACLVGRGPRPDFGLCPEPCGSRSRELPCLRPCGSQSLTLDGERLAGGTRVKHLPAAPLSLMRAPGAFLTGLGVASTQASAFGIAITDAGPGACRRLRVAPL